MNTKQIAERIIAEQSTIQRRNVYHFTPFSGDTGYEHGCLFYFGNPHLKKICTLLCHLLNYAVDCTTLTERIPLTGRIPTLIFSSRDAPAEKDAVPIDADSVGRETTVALGVRAKCL